MNSVRAIIVDDEEPGRTNLENLIHAYCPGIRVIGQASGANEARAMIQHESPDLIYLDVEMPNESGLDLLASLGNSNHQVIFVTAHDKYALRALKLAAFDYLLKPISIRELQVANQRVIDRITMARQEDSRTGAGVFSLQLNSPKLSVPCMGGYEIIEKSSIIHLQGDNNYTTIFTKDKNYLITRTLKEFELALDPVQFVRVHKAHIVNLQYVKQVSHQDGGLIIMDDGSRISVSRRRYNDFLRQLTLFAPILRSC